MFINKNFHFLIIGQIISILGNSIIRFVVPLFILDTTNSIKNFGLLLSMATLPSILFSIFGGLLADNFNRKTIMVVLDFITALILLISSELVLLFPITSAFIIVILLSIIQSFYQPAVQSSIPILVDKSCIEKANSMVSLVNALANISGPILGSMLFSFLGVKIVIIFGAFCFLSSSALEMFIQMKSFRAVDLGLEKVITDIKDSLNFIFIRKPVFIRIMLVISLINLFLTSFFLIVMPLIIKIKLNFSNTFFGLFEGSIATGMIVGALICEKTKNYIKLSNSYRLLSLSAVLLSFTAFGFTSNINKLIIFFIILFESFLIMIFITIFNIKMMTFIQKETPNQLLGKIISYVYVICNSTIPLGQFFYGSIFDNFMEYSIIILFITIAINILISLYAKIVFKKNFFCI